MADKYGVKQAVIVGVLTGIACLLAIGIVQVVIDYGCNP